MAIGKNIGFDRNDVARYRFDGKASAIEFGRNVFDSDTALAVDRDRRWGGRRNNGG